MDRHRNVSNEAVVGRKENSEGEFPPQEMGLVRFQSPSTDISDNKNTKSDGIQ